MTKRVTRDEMTPEQLREMQLSKKLTLVLRHKGPELGVAIDDGGWGLLSDIMRLSLLRGGGYDIDDVKKMVAGNDKQRFTLKLEGDKYYIRANQGHTIKTIDENKLLTPITSADGYNVVVHGTYWKNWASIKKDGLCRMDRNHIHFAKGFNNSKTEVISGYRDNCSVVIVVDLAQALKDGFLFFESSNGVILTPGDSKGYLPSKYFKHVVDPRKNNAVIDKDFPNPYTGTASSTTISTNSAATNSTSSNSNATSSTSTSTSNSVMTEKSPRLKRHHQPFASPVAAATSTSTTTATTNTTNTNSTSSTTTTSTHESTPATNWTGAKANNRPRLETSTTVAAGLGVGLAVARASAVSVTSGGDTTTATASSSSSSSSSSLPLQEVRITRRTGSVQVFALARLFATLRRSVRTSTRKLRNETYHNTFLAHDCVEWICKRFDVPRHYAVDVCEALRLKGLMKAVSGVDRAFSSDMTLYRFVYESPTNQSSLAVATNAALAAANDERQLDASHAALQALPEQLYLASLRKSLLHLSLKGNLLKTLQPMFAQWKVLQTLDLSENELSSLPPSIGDLKSLRTLILDSNELRELPASLNRCPLRTLSASDNPLLELIPAELFVGMTTLGSLKLQQTRIDVLPATLCEAIALVELLVDCDLMYYPPSDICRRGPRAMLEYCADSDNVQPALAVVESDNDSMRRRQGGGSEIGNQQPRILQRSVPTGGVNAFSSPTSNADSTTARPRGPAPAPLRHMPWSERSDSDDFASSALYTWATDAKRIVKDY